MISVSHTGGPRFDPGLNHFLSCCIVLHVPSPSIGPISATNTVKRLDIDKDRVLFCLFSFFLYREYYGRGQIYWSGACCFQFSCDWYQFHHHEKGDCPLSSKHITIHAFYPNCSRDSTMQLREMLTVLRHLTIFRT